MKKTKPISHLRDLKHDPKNARKHNPRNIGMIEKSLNEVGAARSIVIDENGVILAGNGLIDAAAQAGIEKVRVVEASGNEIIAVRRTGLNAKQKQRLALYDNRSQELSAWDADVIAEMARNEKDLLAGLFEEKELRDIVKMADAGAEMLDAEPQIDRAAELNKKWGVKRGDMFAIGSHRLLCGDSTVREDVERLLGDDRLRLFVTDAPYGVSYAKKNKYLNAVAKGNRVQTPIENDDLNAVECQALWFAAYKNAFDFSEDGCPYYICSPQGGELMMMMMMMIQKSGWLLKPHIIWVKNNHVLGRSDYQLKHEPILYGWKPGAHWFYGDRSQMSIWHIDKPVKNEFHPTMKPVELFLKAITNSSIAGDVVGDLFSGSGTTLIACQNLNRKCRAMEIAPEYVAVALERMHTAFPDLKIERIEETHDKAKREAKKTKRH